MPGSRKGPNDLPSSKVRWPDVAEAIKFLDELLETNDRNDDITDWEELKRVLDDHRLSN
ncbi:MAG TPA: hypothetical protein V6D22_15050 [Candidatus Obscuribacterales bacterium]